MDIIVNFSECAEIINNIFNTILDIQVIQGVSLAMVITLTIIIGYVIHGLGNKND